MIPMVKRADLDILLGEGEGSMLEYKEAFSSSLARELVAFANSTGGKILLGVRDDGAVVGARDTNELRARIEDLARNCDPPVRVVTERVGDVVVLTVRESESKPVQCREGFFWRQGAATQKLSRDEIREFFRSEGAIRFDLSICPKFRYPEDFDRKKFNEWLSLSRITRPGRTEDILVNIEAAERSGGRLMFRNAGVLFFAKNVRHFFPQAYVTCLLFRDPDRVHILDRKDFDGGIVSDIEESLRFVERNTRVAYKIDGLQRENITEYPMGAVREAITNAVMHRDYFEAGANVFVDVHPDRIEISNPGGLPKGLTLAELGKKSVRRNQLIADLLQRVDFIEKAGTGILRMTNEARAHGSPPPAFTATNFFTATFRPLSPEQIARQVGAEVKAQPRVTPETAAQVPRKYPASTPQVCAVLRAAAANECSREELQAAAGISDREHFRKEYIEPLLSAGLLERSIPDKPRSPKQRYRTTALGLKALKEKKR
jgi:ATP-dependent DNA helicase RecG